MPTVDYFKNHPLRIATAYPKVTVGSVLNAEKKFADAVSGHVCPAAGAYIHYGGVELADMLTLVKPGLTEQEWEALTTTWYASCGAVAKLLLFYVWRICSKEMRHGNQSKCDTAFKGKGFDEHAVHLCEAISANGDFSGHLHSNSSVNALHYFKVLEQNYRKGGWGGSFGGAKWADIALQFKLYLEGEASALIAADRCWTLVHNTGPIFNKGFYFNVHDGNLMKVLNKQATSSVFDLGRPSDFLKNYSHGTSTVFQEFFDRAVNAIQKVKPDYKPGDTVLKTKSETKPSNKIHKQAHHFGPYAFTTTSDRGTP